jgi:O-succinylbenzoic acid--CoA ligase
MQIPDTLCINGKQYQSDELGQFAVALTQSDEVWQKDSGSFILEWLSPKPEILVHTSGSTGEPRLISHSKLAMLESATATGKILGLQPGQTALLCLSTKTIAGMMMVVRAMHFRMNLIFVPPTGSPLQQLSADTQIDFAAMVPAQVFNSLNDEKDAGMLSRIQQLIIGGGEISKSLEERIMAMPNLVYATYGMTETITHIALRRISGDLRSESFTALPGINLSSDERGCLVIEAPKIIKQPVITNDLVKFTGPFSFIWLGRYDNVINRGGQKIFPEAIERKIAGHINCRFFVTGVPDEKFGEIPVLVMETPHLSAQEETELLGIIKKLCSREEAPVEVFTVKAFVETESGKVNRRMTMKL